MRNLFGKECVGKMFSSFLRAEDFSQFVGKAIELDCGISDDESLVFNVTKKIKHAMFDPELFSSYRNNIAINSAQDFAREIHMSCVLDDMFRRTGEECKPLPELEAFENKGLYMVLQFFGNRNLNGGGFVKKLEDDAPVNRKLRREEIYNQELMVISDDNNKEKSITPKIVLMTILRMIKNGDAKFVLYGEDYDSFMNSIANNIRHERIAEVISAHKNQIQFID